MAVQTSGSFSGSVNSGYQKLIVKWSSVQHEDTGSSTITAEMWFKSAGAISIGSRSNSATIDGTTKSWSSSSISKSSAFEIKLATVTQEVQHDQSTGKKTFSMSSVFNIQATLSGTYYSSITANSGNIELPTIARASTITVDPSNIGSPTTIRITKANDNFSTSLYWRIKNGSDPSWISIDNTANSTYQWTPPASGLFNLYDSMSYTQKTITLEFLAITMNSSYVQVGDDKFAEQTFTAVGNPTVGTKTATDINSVTAQLSSGSDTSTTKMVNGASNVKVEVSATALNGAGIKNITVNGTSLSLNGSASTVTRSGNYTFNKATTNTFTVVVVDSRDHTTTTTTNSLEKINYIPLTLNVTNLKRNSPTNGKIDISVSGNYWTGNFRTNVPNTLTVQYQYQQSGGSWSGWNNISTVVSGTSYSGSVLLEGFDYTKVYNFNFQAIDAVGTVPVSNRTVPKGQPTYWWDDTSFNVNGNLNASGTTNLVGLKTTGEVEVYGSYPHIDFHYNNSTADYTTRVIEESSGQLNFTGNVNAKTIQNMYGCSGTGSSSSTYVRLCNISFNAHTQGEFVGMKIYIGRGNNGAADQQAFIDLSMQLGWTGSNDGRLGCTWELHPMKTTFDLSNVNIIVIANSRTNYDVYLWTSVSYCKPYYVVNCAKSVTITNYGTTSTTAPSGTQCDIKKGIVPSFYKEGTNGVTRTGGATLNSSSWVRFGNVVTLYINFTTTSSTNAGSNVFTGTVANELKPKLDATGNGYQGSSGLPAHIDSDGNLTVRNIAATHASGKTSSVTFTYIV